MDPVDIELQCIVNLYETSAAYRRQAMLFSGSRRQWRLDRAVRLDDIATERMASLLAGSIA